MGGVVVAVQVMAEWKSNSAQPVYRVPACAVASQQLSPSFDVGCPFHFRAFSCVKEV